MSKPVHQVPPRLIELWLILSPHTLYRRIPGGLLVTLPPDSPQRKTFELTSDHLAIVTEPELLDELKAKAQGLYGQDVLLCQVVDDLPGAPQESPALERAALSLRKIVSDLQIHLLESSIDHLPDDIRLLAYLLSRVDYRSTLVPIRRAVYHVVPHQGAWLLKRRGEDHGQSFRTKREAVAAGVKIARSHTHGQLIIHLANGRFEEERTYGGYYTHADRSFHAMPIT